MANIESKLMSLLNKECNQLFSGVIDYCDRSAHSLGTFEIVVDQLVRSNGSDVDLIIDYFKLNREKLASDLQATQSRVKPESGRFRGFEASVLKVLKESWFYTSILFSEGNIRTGHIFLEMIENPIHLSRLLDISIEFKKIVGEELTKNYSHITEGSSENQSSQTASSPEKRFGKAPALARFGVDMTELVRLGQSDPVVGRDKEVREMVTCLMRRRQNNPIMVGEAGVGKTAVVEGLAQRLANGDVPPTLKGASLVSLDIGLLQAGASMKGEFEQRLKEVIDEVQASESLIILFIDEAHTLIGAGGSQGTGDAANLLKPALARGTLRTVAATTNSEYKSFIEPDPALVRRFQIIRVNEPNENDAIKIMRSVAPPMSAHHGVAIGHDAILASVEMSHRYIPSRQLPDKSISLLDTAAAKVSVSQYAVPPQIEKSRSKIDDLESASQMLLTSTDRDTEQIELLKSKSEIEKKMLNALELRWREESDLVGAIVRKLDAKASNLSKAEVDEKGFLDMNDSSLKSLQVRLEKLQGEDPMVFASVDRQAVASVVQDWTGIPVGRMLASQVETLIKLAQLLENRVIGQSHALESIAESIQTTRAGLDKTDKPTGVFMFAGTSGVGKTETAKALAELMYGGEDRLITINMSEFKTPETVTTLKGPPPGYVGNEKGGILTEAVKRNPYSVVLLDEIEKAHSDVNELFFRVFDEGVMDDSNGVEVNFKNVIFILTTNAGTELVMEACKNGVERPPIEEISQLIQAPLESVFSPAFVGRVQVIPFYPLNNTSLNKIIRLQLDRIKSRVSDRGILFSYGDEVVELIASRCLNAESGGRAIDLILNKTLLPEVSRELLTRSAQDESISSVEVSVVESRFNYRFNCK